MKNQANKDLNFKIRIIYFVLALLIFMPMKKPHYSDGISDVVGNLGTLGLDLIILSSAGLSIMLFIWYVGRIGEIKKMTTISKELKIQINFLYVLLIIIFYCFIDYFRCGFSIGFD